jgi:hypothetical protein
MFLHELIFNNSTLNEPQNDSLGGECYSIDASQSCLLLLSCSESLVTIFCIWYKEINGKNNREIEKRHKILGEL